MLVKNNIRTRLSASEKIAMDTSFTITQPLEFIVGYSMLRLNQKERTLGQNLNSTGAKTIKAKKMYSR